MKKILLLAISLLTIAPALTAKDKDKDEEVKIVLVKEENSDEYFYEGVVPVEGVTKEEMFKRAKEWILANLKTVDNNIKFDSDDLSITNNGTFLIEKKVTATMSVRNGACNFKLNMWFKDGRYKFRFDNILVYVEWVYGAEETKPYGQFTKNNKPTNYVKTVINQKILALSNNLEAAIREQSANKADNW